MPSTYSALKIQLMATGENSTTWGDITNTNLGTAIEEAITGSADVTFASADVTLSLTNTNTSQTARNLRLNLTGTTAGARSLIVPAIEKLYLINNGTADTITVKNATGTGIAVPAGKSTFVFNDATNVVSATTYLSSLVLTTALPVSSGGTGSSTGDGSALINLNASSFSSGTMAITRGGTGQTSYTDGQLLIGNSTGNTLTKATLTAGSGISITNGSGAITIATTGGSGTVTSVAFSGGTTGLTVSGSPITSSGTITLSGTLEVANGGTGATNLTGVLIGTGTSAFTTKTNPSGDFVGTTDTQNLTSKTLTTGNVLNAGTSISDTGTISATSPGFRGTPFNSQTGAYALVLTDAGKAVPNTTGGWTIPANASVAFPTGTTIVLINTSASSQSVAITSDTLRWAGIGTTGSRTITAYGVATLIKVAATEWYITGAGVS